ncbi:MAG: LuxR family quorum sensing-dependent transcriptional regulator [Alphaproteobacteria bacterium]|jgi:LuxR family quorum sensing-dependent transcriptional regulator
MNVANALSDIEACTTLHGLKRTMQGIAQGYGFCSFDFVDAGDTTSREPFYLGTSQEAWIDAYVSNEFVRVDPCVARVRRTNLPFVWADVMVHETRRGPKSGGQRLMEAASDFGYTEGLVIPCHFRDRLGRDRSASSVFFWSDPLQRFEFLLTQKRQELHLLMIYFIQACLDIRDREMKSMVSATANNQGRTVGSLTDRERDVLSWAARGKTTSEIADILGLKSDTVEVYFKNNLRKLQASNRTQAVAKALVHGLIDI